MLKNKVLLAEFLRVPRIGGVRYVLPLRAVVEYLNGSNEGFAWRARDLRQLLRERSDLAFAPLEGYFLALESRRALRRIPTASGEDVRNVRLLLDHADSPPAAESLRILGTIVARDKATFQKSHDEAQAPLAAKFQDGKRKRRWTAESLCADVDQQVRAGDLDVDWLMHRLLRAVATINLPGFPAAKEHEEQALRQELARFCGLRAMAVLQFFTITGNMLRGRGVLPKR